MGAIGKLDDLVHNAIVESLEKGASYYVAAGLSGISEDTIHAWKRRGNADLAAGLDTKYGRLSEAIKKARSRVDQRLIDNIQQAAFERDQWQAACWLLERKDGARWGKNSTPRYELVGETAEEKIACVYDLMSKAKMTTQAGTSLIASLQKQQELDQAKEFREEITRLKAIIDEKFEHGGSHNEEIQVE